MRRLILICMCLGLLAAIPVTAQDGCEIDLSETVALLVQAQAAAAADGDEAAELLAEARANLEAMEAECAVTDDNAPEIALTESERLDNELGTLAFNYPEGWAQTPLDDMILLGSSESVLEKNFNSETPGEFQSGEVALLVGLTDSAFYGLDDLDANATAFDVLDMLSQDLPPELGEMIAPSELAVNDRQAAQMGFRSSQLSMTFLLVNLGRGPNGRIFGQAILLTAPEEHADYVPLLIGVAESFVWGER